MVNSPLIRPYLLGGVALGGVPLDSHDRRIFLKAQQLKEWSAWSLEVFHCTIPDAFPMRRGRGFMGRGCISTTEWLIRMA